MPNSASPSPYAYLNRITHDSDEHAEALQAWNQTYDQLSPGHFEGTVTDIWFKGLQIFREQTNRAVAQSGSSWDNAYVLGIPVAMETPGLFSKQLLSRDSMLTFHSDQEFTLSAPADFDVVAVAIPEQTLIEALQPDTCCEIEQIFPKSPTVMLAEQAQMAELRNCLLSIFDPVRFEPELLRYPQVQRAMSSAIVGHVAEVLSSATHAPLPSRSFKGRCQVVRQAVDYAMSNPSEPITVADLCSQLNISRRMLNYCFQDVLATNPVTYLRSLRLNGVRRALRLPLPPGQQIRDIAYKWGFWHLPRFAAEYRALFGELPSETVRQAA